ncbi:hypothetical protein SXANM310S_01750 [Streptomyces xanthochromogenes]
MDPEQHHATCRARVRALRRPHRFGTRDLPTAVAVPTERRGLPRYGDEAPPAAGTRSRTGAVPARTAWPVSDAAPRRPAPENAGAAS